MTAYVAFRKLEEQLLSSFDRHPKFPRAREIGLGFLDEFYEDKSVARFRKFGVYGWVDSSGFPIASSAEVNFVGDSHWGDEIMELFKTHHPKCKYPE